MKTKITDNLNEKEFDINQEIRNGEAESVGKIEAANEFEQKQSDLMSRMRTVVFMRNSVDPMSILRNSNVAGDALAFLQCCTTLQELLDFERAVERYETDMSYNFDGIID